ncbi:MAG TPA: dihydropteroate synthase [Methylocystis sp.]|nr:dihydropteroate synthase [Methylocystis sp.]
MGVVNVTPDSFSDGGLFLAREAALAQAKKLVAEGADIVDVGAESTRPGHAPVSSEEEWRRLEPLLTSLVDEAGAPVSIDTYKAETARRALAAGVVMINDVWGLQRDPAMAKVIGDARALAVIMHNREAVEEGIDIVDDMNRFFERSLEVARRAGVAERFILLDPGVGFGKTRAQNYDALRAIPQLRRLGFPVAVGVSRKSLFRDLSGERIDGRLIGTLAANIVAAGLGAQLFRVHDAQEHKSAFAVLEALRFGEK